MVFRLKTYIFTYRKNIGYFEGTYKKIFDYSIYLKNLLIFYKKGGLFLPPEDKDGGGGKIMEIEIMTVRIDNRGRITLPKRVLEKLNIQPGDLLTFRFIDDGTFLLEKMSQISQRS